MSVKTAAVETFPAADSGFGDAIEQFHTRVEAPIRVPAVVPQEDSAAEQHLRFAPPAETPELRYDPDTIAAYYQQRPFQVWGRIWQIITPFLWFGLTLWWNRRTGMNDRKEKRQAIQLREMLTQLGPAFIKVGQALSTRPDLVPPTYLEELTRLQDQLPPFDNAIAISSLKRS